VVIKQIFENYYFSKSLLYLYIQKSTTNKYMRIKLLLFCTILFSAFSAYAQMPQTTGNLTIFSEDGDKFYLILNGEKQNNVAQTNLRIEDLPQPYYNAKIIFEDQNIPEVSKSHLMITDFNNVFMDVTYKIKKDKNGKVALKYYSAIPIQPDFIVPSNVYVVHNGRSQPPVQQVVVEQNAPVQQTTVTRTTTTTNNPNAGNINMNVGGMGVNVSINDPLLQSSSTTTTTTVQSTNTSTGYNNNSYNNTTPPVQAAQVGCKNQFPMSGVDFNNAMSTLNNEGFDETRLSIAKQVAGSNCLSTNQIIQLCKKFSFDDSRMDFAKFAYDHCTDPKNYFNVANIFSFSSSKEDLNNYIQGR